MDDARYVRVFLAWTDEPETDPFTFDLKLQPDGKPIGKCEFYGVCGARRNDERYPCILEPDGLINFGEYCDDDSEKQGWKTNLHDKIIRLGEMLTIRGRDDDGRLTDWTYKVMSVVVIGERPI